MVLAPVMLHGCGSGSAVNLCLDGEVATFHYDTPDCSGAAVKEARTKLGCEGVGTVKVSCVYDEDKAANFKDTKNAKLGAGDLDSASAIVSISGLAVAVALAATVAVTAR